MMIKFPSSLNKICHCHRFYKRFFPNDDRYRKCIYSEIPMRNLSTNLRNEIRPSRVLASHPNKVLLFNEHKRNYVRGREKPPTRVSQTDNSDDVPSYRKEKVEDLFKNSVNFFEASSNIPGDVWSSSPYPHKPAQRLNYKPTPVDQKQTSIILFPGQGSQFVGMGKELLKYPLVKEMYDIASEILHYDLKKICFEGPKSLLDKTEHCQPAVFVTSLAAVEKLKDEKPQAVENCIATAGFSVGEFASLVFAGGISFEDALQVVKIRAEAMQAASEMVDSGMMTVFYQAGARINYACTVAKEYCQKLGIEQPECSVANFLYPNCKVIAGNKEALQFIETNADEFGIKRCKHLPVSGAFHTDLMLPAKPAVEKILETVKLNPTLIPVHTNIMGRSYLDEKDIRKGLIKQMSYPVKWEQIMHIIYSRKDGVDFPFTYECGPGSTLKAILKKVNAKAFACTEKVKV